MKDNVLIVSVEKSEILAVPMITGACINCEKSSCAKRGKPFAISNPQNLPVSKGSIVKIKSNKKAQIFQGFAALILPIIFAVACFFLGSFLAEKFVWKNVEMAKALFSLLGLTVTSLIILAINAKSHLLRKSEISEIVS